MPKNITFGKHKGEPWADLDQDYIQWIVDNFDADWAKSAAQEELDRRSKEETDTTEKIRAAVRKQVPTAPNFYYHLPKSDERYFFDHDHSLCAIEHLKEDEKSCLKYTTYDQDQWVSTRVGSLPGPPHMKNRHVAVISCTEDTFMCSHYRLIWLEEYLVAGPEGDTSEVLPPLEEAEDEDLPF